MKKFILGMVYCIISFLILLPFIGIISKSFNLNMGRYVLTSTSTYRSLLTTLWVVIITMFINFLIGTPLAAFMARENFKGKKILELLIILPLIIPAMVSTMGLQFAFIKLGLIETVLGVALIHSISTMPYYIQSMRAGYVTLNRDYINLGKVLGATPIQRFFHITLPVISPSFLAGMTLVIIVSLAQYLGTFIIGGGQVMTFPILMMPYLSDGGITNGIIYSIIYVIFTYFLVHLTRRGIKFVYRNK